MTTLVIPGLNDTDDELRWVASYLHDELGPDVPWHISRFYPNYRMNDVLPTPASTLERAWQIGLEAACTMSTSATCPATRPRARSARSVAAP